ncbi:MAG: glycosyltransferase [Xanthobacteraceae bacterium]
MLSVVIPTRESERLLVPTLSALVPGAVAGVVREVIVADAGSQDATAQVADVAGCRFEAIPGALGARLVSAAALARAPWLLFLRPGCVPEPSWIEEIEGFVRECELAADERAAVFRSGGRGRSAIVEMLALAAAIFARARPEQGLLIAKEFYGRLGGHDANAAAPEAELLRRLGSRRVTVLRCAMAQSR